MRQSRFMSLIEAVANIVIGYGVALVAQLAVFPIFDLHVDFSDNLLIGAVFTTASLARSYAVRRAFERWRVSRQG